MQGYGDVIGDLVVGDWDYCGMVDCVFGEDCDIGGVVVDIYQVYVQFFFVFGQY